ncbi:MAG TPA: HlyD family secretion protein [Chthoniobacter sp.]|jgi:membrane fusion protein (multidrug efflux system)
MSRSIHETHPETEGKTAFGGEQEESPRRIAARRHGPQHDEPHDQEQEEDADDLPAEDDGETSGKEGGKKGAKGYRPSKKAIFIGGAIVLILIIGGILLWLHARNYVTTDDAYTTGHVHPISARIAGTVEKVLVDDNQFVKTNDVLVQLDPRDNEVALEKARASLQQAQAQATQSLAKVAQTRAQQSAAQAQVLQAKAQVSQAKAQLEKAQADYDRIAGLFTKDLKAVSKADVDAATASYDSARSVLEANQANVASATAQLEAAAANVKASEGDQQVAEANVAVAETQIKDGELQLSYCNIHAPVAGRVSKKTVEEGQRLQPGQALMAIVPENIWVLANLKETQLDRLKVGQRVDIRIDALPGKTFYGSVDSLQEGSGATFSLLPPDNATGNFTKIVQRVPVKIVFDPNSIRDYLDKIVPGLSVESSIDLRSLRDNRAEPKREQREEKQNRDAESGK